MELFLGTQQMGVGARGVLHISEVQTECETLADKGRSKEGGHSPSLPSSLGCDRDWDGDRAPAGPVEETARGSRTPSQQEIKLPCLCWLEALTHFSSARPNIEGKRRS